MDVALIKYRVAAVHTPNSAQLWNKSAAQLCSGRGTLSVFFLKRLKIEDWFHTIDSGRRRSSFYVAWWFPSSIMIHHVPCPALPLYQFAALFAVSACASSGRRSMWLRSLALA